MKLKQTLINILGNSVKFTPSGGKVTLNVERTAHYEGNSTLRFTMKDTGIGMDKAFLPKLFDAFSQEDSSKANKYGSTGLGMAITRSIVEMMNGNIEVESEKGIGTTFIVTVTLLDSERQAAELEQTPEAAENIPAAAALEGRKILLAEDMDINAEIMLEILQMRGMEA